MNTSYQSISRWSDFKLRISNSEYRPVVVSTRDYVFTHTPTPFKQPQKVITYIRIANLYNAMFYDRLKQRSFLDSRKYSKEVSFMLKHWGVFQFEVRLTQISYNPSVFKELNRNWKETCLQLPEISSDWVIKSVFEAESLDLDHEEIIEHIRSVHSKVIANTNEWSISNIINSQMIKSR